jgi:hypothetical protein
MSDEPGEEPEESPETEVPEIQKELDAAVQRRHFTNAVMQGAAVSNNFAFAYYSADDLNAIDPQLVPAYGKLMSLSQLGYWVQDDSTVRAAIGAHGGKEQGGSEEISFKDGVPTIIATGATFPFLVHELVKGLMEYLSLNDEDDSATRKQVHAKADFIDEETWSMLLGPGLWKQFLDAIGGTSREIVPHLYDEIIRMPDSQFNALMKGVVEGTPQARQQLKLMADKIRAALGDDQVESQATLIVNKLLT